VDLCTCQDDADCIPFDDGNKCNGTLFCDQEKWPYLCQIHPASVVKCPTVFDTTCVKSTCQPATGLCLPVNVPDQTACDDGLKCTAGDMCTAGLCLPTGDKLCDDGNPCTEDSCFEGTGCINKPVPGPCSDGSACTTGDACSGGNCIGYPVLCEDGNPCTKGICDPATGECAYPPTPGSCNDGKKCTQADQCQQGVCAGTPVDCSDGYPCTADSCDEKNGCVHQLIGGGCNDGNLCTHSDTCAGAYCLGIPVACDDGDPCSDDTCKPAVGCVHEPNFAPCDDGDACTYGDSCDGGACSGLLVDCDDGNPCTAASCHPIAGCVHQDLDVACSDQNLCTLGDWCTEGECIPGKPLSCDDGNVCTLDSCSPATGLCSFLPQGKWCDDQDLCTTQDLCQAGLCSGFPVDCDDADPCTSDACQSDSGCVHAPLDNAFCTDNDPCTAGDLCQGGVCVGQETTDCNDSNPCTADWCKTGLGCKHDPVPEGACPDKGHCVPCLAGTCNVELQVCIPPGWVAIPAGTLAMGSPPDEPCRDEGEGPRHEVSLSHALLASDHEVTQQEWEAVVGLPAPAWHGPNGGGKDCVTSDCPVEQVNWYEALAYCNLLSVEEGLEPCYVLEGCTGTLGGGCTGEGCAGDYQCQSVLFSGLACPGFRLPTEAEWERLARAGIEAAFPFPAPAGSGKEAECACAEEDALQPYAWYCHNSGAPLRPAAGASLQPNAWKLFDTAGNVREWVWDVMDGEYYAFSPAEDPAGPDMPPSEDHVVRGGCYASPAADCRPAARASTSPTSREPFTGLRPVRSLP
jgi:formylglycine-generating enzyme required for sulfatase activity